MKNITKVVIGLGTVLALVAAVAIGTWGFADKPEMMAAFRQEEPSEYTTIVPNDVPLAKIIQASNNQIEQKAADSFTQTIVNLTNAERAKVGVASLGYSNQLAQAGAVRAQEISSKWSHTRPNGKDWWTVDPSVMYGENLAKGYKTAEATVTGWMNSPAHRDNILYSGFKTIGIGVYVDQAGTYYVTQEFGY